MLDTDAGWMPLYLSTIAGMSTCLGVLIVFCHPIDNDEDENEENRNLIEGNSSPSRLRKRFSGKRKVSPSTMAFSLALAGSVMVTVSVVSSKFICMHSCTLDLSYVFIINL